MIGEDGQQGQRKLTPVELEDAQNALGFMVPGRIVAAQYGITEGELRRQLNLPPKRAPEPPVEKAGLIGPKHVQQMAKRKAWLKSLRKQTEGHGDG